MKGRIYVKHDYLKYIEIVEEVDGISEIHFRDEILGEEIESSETLKCKREIEEYFRGERTEFTVKLDIRKGTEFQKSCWDAMKKIPYGETISYGEEAKMINNPKAVRAVGGANNKNPISIVVP